jgi:hypothetical protein
MTKGCTYTVLVELMSYEIPGYQLRARRHSYGSASTQIGVCIHSNSQDVDQELCYVCVHSNSQDVDQELCYDICMSIISKAPVFPSTRSMAIGDTVLKQKEI